MSIDTTSSFSQNRNSIITDAMFLLGALGEAETPDDADIQICQRALNRMLKTWEAQGHHIFGTAEATLFPVLSQAKYSIDATNGTAHCTNSYSKTTLTANAIIGATVLTVASNAGMTNGDFIGIIDSTGNLEWTTIVSSTSTTVTITTGLTQTATSGSYIYNYTNNINRPLKIRSARSFDVASDTDTHMGQYSHSKYFDITSKTSVNDQPTNFYYDPQLNAGNLYLWSTPGTCNKLIKFTYDRPVADMNSATSDIDFPQEWLDPIIYGLAVRVGPFFGLTKMALTLLPLANALLQQTLSWDNESSPLQFEPNSDDFE